MNYDEAQTDCKTALAQQVPTYQPQRLRRLAANAYGVDTC